MNEPPHVARLSCGEALQSEERGMKNYLHNLHSLPRLRSTPCHILSSSGVSVPFFGVRSQWFVELRSQVAN